MLASLPVRLELGTLAAAAAEGISPLRMSLVGAWAAMVLAALAVAALLQGVLSLSERRGAFVSAVTHELRTPLTTFRMYAEMLASNMVPDETSRQHYLETLRVEADRLTHLVENVLLYARLERGRPGGRISPVAVSRILEQATGRLTDRARQANLEIAVEASEDIRESLCAGRSGGRRADSVQPGRQCLQVCGRRDRSHAPSRSPPERQPCRTAAARSRPRNRRRAAASAFSTVPQIGPRRGPIRPPASGLGLALCRRLARDMGGELSYAPDVNGGACFNLRLRVA